MKRFILLIPLLLCAVALQAAEYHTPNFTVYCSDSDLARQIGDTAELFRKQHAQEWLGRELPKWYSPCPVHVKHGQVASGGATSFTFDSGEVTGWQMNIFGSPDRLLDSVVPHEVLHTIFACRFRRPLPRWADEGAATYAEAEAERKQYRDAGLQAVGTQEHIPLSHLLAATEYPADGRKVFLFYGQSFVLAEYLLDLKGRPEYVSFLDTYFKTKSWETAFRKHYALGPGEAYTGAIQVNKPPSTPVDYNTYHIDIFVQSKCPPCETFKTQELPKLMKAKNLKVRVLDMDKDYTWERAKQDGITGTPAFIVYRNEKRQAVLQGLHTAEQLLAKCKGAKTVKVAQGIGIGYFGPVGRQDSGNRANPHNDFSAAQLQQLNQIIDQRSQLAIDGTITNRMSDLEKLMDSRIQNAFLVVESKLTDGQKAMIGATDEQKAIIAGFKDQLAAVEAGKAKLAEEHKKALGEVQEQAKALATEVEAAKTETTSLKAKLTGLAKEGAATAASSVMSMLGISTPPALAMTLIGGVATFLWNRRKKDELAKKT